MCKAEVEKRGGFLIRVVFKQKAYSASDDGMGGGAVKNSLEIIFKQVHLEGGFERGGRIRVVECLRQIVPDR